MIRIRFSEHASIFTVCTDRMVVLLLQSCRTTGHRVLCTAKETITSHIPPRVPSLDDGILLVDLPEVLARGAGYFPGTSQLICTRDNVHVLSDLGAGTTVSEVLVVEEIHDNDSAGR